jgi:alanine dehydrogenase
LKEAKVAIFLSNDDVRRLLSMDECIKVIEDLFQQESRGLVENIARRRMGAGIFGATYMGGSVVGSQAYGMRHSSVTVLYNTESGRLEAVLEPGTLAWIRTGAASGVATKHMARQDASVVGMIGTGRQAMTQLEAVALVRPLQLVKVYSRRPENREQFAETMRKRLELNVEAAESPEDCVRGSDIVITITNSSEPVFDGSALEAGTHINAAGANSRTRREIDETTLRRSEVIAVDNIEQAKLECGEHIEAAEQGSFRWEQAVPLYEVVSGKVKGRPSSEAITLFESQGIGIEDIAASAYVLQKAKAQGIGVELPF